MAEVDGDGDAQQAADFDAIMATRTDVYASGPLCWGPLQWMSLHQMARGYPQKPSAEKQAAVRAYVIALIDLLPCSICAVHWKAVAPTVNTESRNAFLRWTIDVHNKVNKRTGKPVLTYPEALDTILNTCKDNCLSISTVDRDKGSKTKHHHHHHNGGKSRTSMYIISAVIALLFVTLLVLLLVAGVRGQRHAKLEKGKASVLSLSSKTVDA